MKRLILPFLLLLFVLVGCGDSKPDLNGNWISDPMGQSKSYDGLVIDGDTIQIYFYNNKDKDQSLLAWEGTIKYPESTEEPYEFVATKDATKGMPAMSDQAITFTLQDGKIFFVYNTQYGVTQQVVVHREDS